MLLLTPDGGLYVPLNGLPKLTSSEWQRLVDMSFPERAQVLLERYIHPADVPSAHLLEIVERAYGENFACSRIAPVRYLMHNQYVLELFHGPTASFKYLSLQLMPQLFAYCIPQTCTYLLLVATSGDTGSAVLEGFNNLSDIDKQRITVLAFFPEKDILKSSNLERYLYLISNGDWQLVRVLYSQLERHNLFRVPGSLRERIQQDFPAGWCSEEKCLATIQSVHSAAGYILDPHTAVAKVVADRLQDGTCPVVIASTAHYAKFAPAVLKL
ncbi:Threonine synthase-like 1 [Acipenser ruthenus]|uniref:Threonine synthase-like 1 n=1 Tax=Acipenser ruthenus TaxID=7906 RepID=A0A444TWI3_ACIRT|nr:Threonine synthase-like 1 [Acipenser ruthenus]